MLKDAPRFGEGLPTFSVGEFAEKYKVVARNWVGTGVIVDPGCPFSTHIGGLCYKNTPVSVQLEMNDKDNKRTDKVDKAADITFHFRNEDTENHILTLHIVGDMVEVLFLCGGGVAWGDANGGKDTLFVYKEGQPYSKNELKPLLKAEKVFEEIANPQDILVSLLDDQSFPEVPNAWLPYIDVHQAPCGNFEAGELGVYITSFETEKDKKQWVEEVLSVSDHQVIFTWFAGFLQGVDTEYLETIRDALYEKSHISFLELAEELTELKEGDIYKDALASYLVVRYMKAWANYELRTRLQHSPRVRLLERGPDPIEEPKDAGYRTTHELRWEIDTLLEAYDEVTEHLEPTNMRDLCLSILERFQEKRKESEEYLGQENGLSVEDLLGASSYTLTYGRAIRVWEQLLDICQRDINLGNFNEDDCGDDDEGDEDDFLS